MRITLAVLLVALVASSAYAGWDDLTFDSPEKLSDVRQGRNVSLSLNVTNPAHEDGYAVYLLNVTLYPPPCINGGRPVTSVGAIICPKDDPSCRNRYSSASTTALFNFTEMATDVDCSNGLKEYKFGITGTKELIGADSRWSSQYTTNTSTYSVRFIGPDVCGDGFCSGNETCATCNPDCGRCTECTGGERACRNNSIYLCVNGFYTYLAEQCPLGCEDTDGAPSCRRLCEDGEKRCSEDGTAVQTCSNNVWRNDTCVRGCVDGACQSNLCLNVVCADYCQEGVARSYGSCNPSTGSCTFFDTRNCQYGCLGATCAPAPLVTPTPAPTPGGVPCQCGTGLALLFLCSLALAISKRAC